MTAEKIIEELCKLQGVDAVAIGGSRASGNADENSDYDVYVYFMQKPDEQQRRNLLEPCCRALEIGNHYWEYEDNCILDDGTPMDIIYRPIMVFTDKNVTFDFLFGSKNGYSTCFLHNIATCKIVYDKSGAFSKLQQGLIDQYPDKMRRDIIERNMKLIHGQLPSYDNQIKKAVERNDLVSINHRTTGFLESYFDVIFALNRMTHPGEKKLIKICKERCSILPKDFEKNLKKLFSSMYKKYDFNTLNRIIEELEKTVQENM
ncbi:MAG: nucleotidyltransferase domain-containing protein [Ruminococcus sp.]